MAEEHASATGPGEPTEPTGIVALPSPDSGVAGKQPELSPPIPAPPDIALKPQTRLAPLDLILTGLLVLLTFFLGSFAIFNADIWMHLASGRLLAAGEYQFGVDPFAYTTANVVWVNQSWLFDWLIYLIHRLAGGEGLVVCKALLLVALMVVLVGMRRPERSPWLPIVFVGLAMLALSARALLQPTIVSFFLLGLTLYWLVKAGAEDVGGRRLWLLPALFILWVNLDAWFILGPLTVLLFWLGALLDTWTGRSCPLRPALLGKILLVGLAACLVNPHHFRAFALPAELASLLVRFTDHAPSWLVASGQTLNQLGVTDFTNWLSPLAWQYRSQPALGYNVAGLAYFLLLLGGLASFVVPLIRNPRQVHFPLLLVWVFFALLSLVQARMIPFFAVVGGPIAFLSFQDAFARAQGSLSAPVKRLWLAGRLATVLAFMGLVFLAWPGWLNGPIGDFQSQRRVTCGLHIDPSLYLTAFRLSELKEKGKIRQGLALHPDVACYCSWFAPEVKGFIDYRYGLFANVAERFSKIRKSLWRKEVRDTRNGPVVISDPDMAEWRQFAAEYNVNCLVLSNFDRSLQTQLLVKRLWLEKKKWPILYEDGRTLVFDWTDSEPRDYCLIQAPASKNKPAFSQVPAAKQAPGMGFPAVDHGFWRKYFLGTEEVPLASAKAQLDHVRYLFWSQHWQLYYLYALQVTFVSQPAAFAAAGPGVWLPASSSSLIIPALHARDAGPPADPILMMRHARMGVAADDRNPQAYLVLSDAAKLLWKGQEDHWSLGRGQGAPLRTSVRQIQTIAALKTYLVLKPENPGIHEVLGEMYEQLYYLDVALEHFSLALRYMERLRPSAANRAARENFDLYKRNLEFRVRSLADAVKQRRADFDLRTAGLGPLEKFDWAIRRPYKPLDLANRGKVDPRGFGLANRALLELQHARIEQLNQAQRFQLTTHQMYLLLTLGKLRDVEDALPYVKELLGPFHAQYELLWAAAIGNYLVADEALEVQIKALQLEKKLPVFLSSYLQALAPCNSAASRFYSTLFLQNQDLAHFALRQGAELYLVRGLMALEKGDVDKAAGFFQKSLNLVGTSVYFPDRPIAERYLELIRKK